MIHYLTAEQILSLHEYALDLAGGEEGGGHRGHLGEGADAVAQAVRNSYYDTVPELGAAYAVYTIQGHAFLDACKRTGSFAMMTFLEANGITLRSDKSLEIQACMLEMQRLCEPEDGSRPWPTDRLVAWIARKIERGWMERKGQSMGRAPRTGKVSR